MELKIATGDEQIVECYLVLKELRPELDEQQFLAMINLQQTQGYQLLTAFTDGQLVAVAGFVIGYKLAWGKHLYIDDLVTSADCRSNGVGKSMFDWLITYALEQGCSQVHLDSGVQRFSAHKFYLRENMRISSHHFQLDINR